MKMGSSLSYPIIILFLFISLLLNCYYCFSLRGECIQHMIVGDIAISKASFCDNLSSDIVIYCNELIIFRFFQQLMGN